MSWNLGLALRRAKSDILLNLREFLTKVFQATIFGIGKFTLVQTRGSEQRFCAIAFAGTVAALLPSRRKGNRGAGYHAARRSSSTHERHSQLGITHVVMASASAAPVAAGQGLLPPTVRGKGQR